MFMVVAMFAWRINLCTTLTSSPLALISVD